MSLRAQRGNLLFATESTEATEQVEPQMNADERGFDSNDQSSIINDQSKGNCQPTTSNRFSSPRRLALAKGLPST